MEINELASMVDHTLLSPDATASDINQLCQEAEHFGCAAVCVNPSWVRQASLRLSDSQVVVCSVVGFPLGASCSQSKAQEAALACSHGAQEIDMVINLGRFLSGQNAAVREDIMRVRESCPEAQLKVIIESAALDELQIARVCGIAIEAGADWLKTSTGMHQAGGASEKAVKMISQSVAGKAKVKASGAIRSLAQAKAMIDAGASRLGLSSTVTILEEQQ